MRGVCQHEYLAPHRHVCHTVLNTFESCHRAINVGTFYMPTLMCFSARSAAGNAASDVSVTRIRSCCSHTFYSEEPSLMLDRTGFVL